MKTKISSVLWITIFYLALQSCQKELSYETPTGGNADTASGDFRAKINDTVWQAAPASRVASIIAGVINVTGISSDNTMITITLVANSTGTYPIGPGTLNFAAFNELSNGTITNTYSTNQGLDTTQPDGSVTITQIDSVNKTISGTFYFSGYDQAGSLKKVVTEGVFNKIPYMKNLPPASSSDTFKVVIDGTPWTAPSIIAQPVGGQLYIAGLESDASRTVGLYMPENIISGSYAFDALGGTYIGQYSPDPNTLLLSFANGTLTIISNDTINRRIKGNFNFTATDMQNTKSSQLTQGYFSVSY